MAWLHLSQILNEPEYQSFCAENAEILMTDNPGPKTDIMGGGCLPSKGSGSKLKSTQSGLIDGFIPCVLEVSQSLPDILRW
jgi:hypothetical protein